MRSALHMRARDSHGPARSIYKALKTQDTLCVRIYLLVKTLGLMGHTSSEVLRGVHWHEDRYRVYALGSGGRATQVGSCWELLTMRHSCCETIAISLKIVNILFMNT
jgi:hypothetical protein